MYAVRKTFADGRKSATILVHTMRQALDIVEEVIEIEPGEAVSIEAKQ